MTVDVYREGLCYLSVCTDEPDEAVVAKVNPSGTRNGWRIADEPFASGEPNPSPCNLGRDGFRHVLLEC